MKVVEEVKERIETEKMRKRHLTQEEIDRIMSLSEQLGEVWRHPDTDPTIKKRIIRMVVEEVVILMDNDQPLLTMTIHWKGGVHSQVQFKKPVKGEHRHTTDKNVLELLARLAPHLPDEEIAKVFNCHKLKTGKGNFWNRTRVRSLRAENKIAPFDRTKSKDVLSMNEAAKQLNVSGSVIRTLINNGIINATQVIKFAPWEIKDCELTKPIVTASLKRLKEGHTLKSLRGISPDQLSLC
ncbi:MAG: hypothetical protein QME81_18335 [bacterium]|nr:hypothetical protein [bacterium]